jgi:uncharacterized damage-inducible protein DinB
VVDMTVRRFTVSSTEAIAGLIEGRSSFEPPSRVLDGLSSDQAAAKLDGWPHSIAELVAHMLFWQRNDIAAIETGSEPPEPTPAEDWPEVTRDDWPRLRDEFLASLERTKEMARDPELLDRTVLGDPFTVGLRMVWFTGHNAYHLGQVVLLRRILGAWPPRGGG